MRAVRCRSVVAEGGLQQVDLGLDAVLIVRLEGLDLLRAVDLAVEQGDAVLQAQRALDEVAEGFRQVVPAGCGLVDVEAVEAKQIKAAPQANAKPAKGYNRRDMAKKTESK